MISVYFSFLSFPLSLGKGLLILFLSENELIVLAHAHLSVWQAKPLCAWAMCFEELLSNDHSGVKDSKLLSFPVGTLWQGCSGLPVVFVLGLGDREEPRGR